MNVTQILKLKGSNTIETISPGAQVSDAVALLSERKIGALVVSQADGDIAGIVSERDIVRLLGTDGAAVLTRSVDSLMTHRVESCQPHDTAMSVLERMTDGRFRHMPVVDGGRMVGFLSIGDVVKARIAEIESDNAAMAEMLHG